MYEAMGIGGGNSVRLSALIVNTPRLILPSTDFTVASRSRHRPWHSLPRVDILQGRTNARTEPADSRLCQTH